MAWKLQFARRPKGRYYQLVGPDRKTVSLGYLTDEQVGFAEGNIAFYVGRHPEILTTFDPQSAKQALLRDPDEVDRVAAYWRGIDVDRKLKDGDYSTLTLREYHDKVWRDIRKEEVSETTHQREQRWEWPLILRHLGDVRVVDLDQPKWNGFLASLTNLAASSKRRVQNAYAICLAHMVEIGAIKAKHTFRPIRGAQDFKTAGGEALTADEVRRLLDAAPSKMHRALYAVAFGMGLRPAEVTRVRWEDIDWQKKMLTIRGTKTALSSAAVPMTTTTYKEMHSYWTSASMPATGHAFTIRGKPIGTWKPGLHTSLKRAGLYYDSNGNRRNITQYSGRYTFATLAAASGIPNAVAKNILRHSARSKMLETVYQRFNMTQISESLNAFPSFEQDSPPPLADSIDNAPRPEPVPQAAQASAVPAPAPAEAQPTTTKIKPSKRTVTINRPKVAPVVPAPTPLIPVAEGYYDDFIV